MSHWFFGLNEEESDDDNDNEEDDDNDEDGVEEWKEDVVECLLSFFGFLNDDALLEVSGRMTIECVINRVACNISDLEE